MSDIPNRKIDSTIEQKRRGYATPRKIRSTRLNKGNFFAGWEALDNDRFASPVDANGFRIIFDSAQSLIQIYENEDLRVQLGEGQIAFLGPGSVGGGALSSLGTTSIVLTGGEAEVWLSSGLASLYPGLTNDLDLGGTSNRWKTVYSVNADDISSDRRQKKNIKTLKRGLIEVLKMHPVSFVRKGEKEIRLGFIAQELEEILPEVVSIDEKGNYGVAYTELIPVLVRSIQELSAKVEKLEGIIKRKK